MNRTAKQTPARTPAANEKASDRKPVATKAESVAKIAETVTKKVGTVTPPSVQWKVPPENNTPAGDADDKSLSSEDGVESVLLVSTRPSLISLFPLRVQGRRLAYLGADPMAQCGRLTR